MKYISKPTVVDAFQWDANLPKDEWPEWLQEAERRFIFAVYEIVGMLSTGPNVIKNGDWIIRKENGDLWSYSNEEFKKKYVRMAEPNEYQLNSTAINHPALVMV